MSTTQEQIALLEEEIEFNNTMIKEMAEQSVTLDAAIEISNDQISEYLDQIEVCKDKMKKFDQDNEKFNEIIEILLEEDEDKKLNKKKKGKK